MLEDVLAESWVYQEIEGKGKEKGREEELRHILVRITTRLFPDLVSLAQKQVERGKSADQLRTIVDKLVTASTDQEARDVLMS